MTVGTLTRGSVNPYESEKLWSSYTQANEGKLGRVGVFHDLIPPGSSRLLDLGCGTGSISNGLRLGTVVGVDITKIALRHFRGEKVLADAAMLPLKEEFFELVISAEMFEHLRDDSHAKAAKEVMRLNPRAILISVPYREDLDIMSSWCRRCGVHFNAYHHYRSYVPSDIDAMFAGYTRDRTEFITPIAHPSRWVILLGRKFGYYRAIEGEICATCGSKVDYPPVIIRLVFGGLRRISLVVNKILRRQRPYHMVLRYQRL